jgi:hypothetical protein
MYSEKATYLTSFHLPHNFTKDWLHRHKNFHKSSNGRKFFGFLRVSNNSREDSLGFTSYISYNAIVGTITLSSKFHCCHDLTAVIIPLFS